VRTFVRMTSRGGPLRRFADALSSGNPGLFTPAALELPMPIHLSHGGAIALKLRDVEPSLYSRSAVRFGEQFAKRRRLPMTDPLMFQAILVALATRHPEPAAAALEAVLRAHNEPVAADVVRRWLSQRQSEVNVDHDGQQRRF
jgi:hypothetical protein